MEQSEDDVSKSHSEEVEELDTPEDHETIEEEEVGDLERHVKGKHRQEALIECHSVELHDLLQDVKLGK